MHDQPTDSAGDVDQEAHQDVGNKLRLRRKIKGLSLQDVAERSGLSVGQLSQVERGVSSPSLRSLRQICAVLGMPMGWLFERHEPLSSDAASYVLPASQRRTLDLGAKGMIKQLLTPDACSSVQMMRIVVQPGGDSGVYTARGVAETGVLLSGSMGLEVDGQQTIIQPQDAFAFEGVRQVRFWCIGDEPCELIWTATPALY
ncbi:helix-turn-helix domain-containing protein [Pseudomonas silvicola]|nr:helix-turn-helix domain-containing protein [Pseudomonas silvicola]